MNETFRYLRDFRTPIQGELRRVDTGHNGNLEGYYNRGITANEEWVYENPFIPGRLSDDEIAIATSLTKWQTICRVDRHVMGWKRRCRTIICLS